MQALIKNNWTVVLVIAVLMILGFFLRVPQLSNTDFWYDEAFTGMTVRQSWPDMFKMIAQDRHHPALYYALLKGWSQIFGSTDPVTLRAFSLVWGIAVIPMVYLVIQQLAQISEEKRKTLGVFSAFFLSISPFYVTYSAEARSYSMLLFLMLLSLFFFLRVMKKPFVPSLDLIFWLLSLVVIFFTHYLGILIVAGYGLAYLFVFLDNRKVFDNPDVWSKIGWGSFVLWVLSTYVWYRLDLSRFYTGANLGWIPLADLAVIPRTIADFMFGINRQISASQPINSFSFPLYTTSLGMLAFIIGIAGLTSAFIKKAAQQKRELITLTLVAVTPLLLAISVSQFGLQIYIDRYMIGYITFIFILFGYAWIHFSEDQFTIGLLLYTVLLFFIKLPPSNHQFTEVTQTAAIVTAKTIYVSQPTDYLVYRYYIDTPSNLFLRSNPAGQPYNWPFIPPSVEAPLVSAKKGDLLIIQNSENVPVGWSVVEKKSQYSILER